MWTLKIKNTLIKNTFGVEYTPKDIRKFIVNKKNHGKCLLELNILQKILEIHCKQKKSWQIFIEYKHTIQ